MSIQRIAYLTPKCKTETLEVRIIKKWKTYQHLDLRLLFVDEHGDAIEAATDVHSSTYFNDLIRPKTCHRITGFVCIEGRASSKVVNHDATILFGRSAIVIPIESSTILVYYFSFAPYLALHTRMVEKNKVLTDFIGRYIDAKEIPNRTGKGLLRVKLQDESGKMIEVALWEEIAIGFNRKAAESDPDPAIIAVTSLKVSTFGGALQLASTSASETYINPCISQLPVLIQRFKHIPAYEIPSPPARNQLAESNLTLLSRIMNQLYEAKKETTYMCLARITEIQCGDGKGWYYESCIKCANKAYQSGHQYYCLAHGFRDEHSYCYRFTGTIADDSCTADAVFFDSIVTSLVGTTCYDMVVTQQNNNPKILPAKLKQLINKPFIFEIQAKNDNQSEAIGVNKAYEAPSSPATTPTATAQATSSSIATPATPSVKTSKRTSEQGAEPRLKQKTKEQ